MSINSRPSSTVIYFSLGFGILSIATSALLVSYAAVPGAVAGAYRMTISVLLLGIPFFLRFRNVVNSGRREILFALLGGVLFAGDIIFWNTGVLLSGATNPTLMANSAPLWVGLGTMIIFKERLHGRFWIGLVLAMIGAAIVMQADASISSDSLRGTIYGLIAGVFYGGFHLVTQRGRQKLDALSYFWLSTAASAVLLSAAALILKQPFTGYSINSYLALLAMGVLIQTIGWLSINYAQGHLKAAVVAPTLLAQPVLTAILAWPLLGEQLTAPKIIGGTAVIIGILIVHRSFRRATVPLAG